MDIFNELSTQHIVMNLMMYEIANKLGISYSQVLVFHARKLLDTNPLVGWEANFKRTTDPNVQEVPENDNNRIVPFRGAVAAPIVITTPPRVGKGGKPKQMQGKSKAKHNELSCNTRSWDSDTKHRSIAVAKKKKEEMKMGNKDKKTTKKRN